MDPKLIGPSVFLAASILVILLIISVVILLLRRKTRADMAMKEELDPEKMKEEMLILAAVKIANREQVESGETKPDTSTTREYDDFLEGEILVDG